MGNKLRTIILAHILILFFISNVFAQFFSLETKNLRLIYYSKGHEFIVPHLARCFENSLGFHRQLFNYTPSEKVTVFLQDFTDYHNAGASSVPRNFITMDLAPANYVFEHVPANERMNHTMSHELVHIAATDQAAGSDNFFRSAFFGKVWASQDHPTSILYSYLTSPRNLSPRWYHEGLAVFWDTRWPVVWDGRLALMMKWCSGPWCATEVTSMTSWV